MSIWRYAKDFIELAFSIDKHFPGFVDGYFGPIEIKESVEHQEKTDLKVLSATANKIIESTQHDNTLIKERKEYLIARLTGMQTILEILQGKQLDIIEEVQQFFDIQITWIDEKRFETSRQILDEYLPGSGSLYDRWDTLRKVTIIPENKLEFLVKNISLRLQNLSKEFIPLPESENCEYFLVKDKDWVAYNWYLGNYRSRIEINTDLPNRILSLPWFIAHEAYPGHHTENSMKEYKLYQEKGYLENSILTYNTPDNVITEGVGENALDVVANCNDIVDIYNYICHEIGFKDIDANSLFHIMKALRDFDLININLVLMVYGRGATDKEVIDYQIKYRFNSLEGAKQNLRFLRNPLYRSYACVYPMGRQLVHNYVSAGMNQKERFLKLLQEQLIPSQLKFEKT